MRFRTRRRLAAALLVITAGISLLATQTLNVSLRDTSILTGLVLLAVVTGLLALNARKKLPFFPVFPSAVWMQVHIYVGLFAAVVYVLHAGFRMPNGGLELALAALFWTVIVSGALGLLVMRTVPKRLRSRGEPVIFERHPLLRRELRDRLAAQVGSVEAPALAEFYARRLVPFFAAPRDFWQHLLGWDRSRIRLLRELRAQARFLDEKENGVRQGIEELIETKSDLDYHYAHQAALKYWLFAHIPLSYSLLITGVLHGVIAYSWTAR